MNAMEHIKATLFFVWVISISFSLFMSVLASFVAVIKKDDDAANDAAVWTVIAAVLATIAGIVKVFMH